MSYRWLVPCSSSTISELAALGALSKSGADTSVGRYARGKNFEASGSASSDQQRGAYCLCLSTSLDRGSPILNAASRSTCSLSTRS